MPATSDAERWSVGDVHQWAQAQAQLAPVADVLRQHAVDGHVLLHYVTNAILAEELGIAAFGTRVHILEAIETLRWALGRDVARGSNSNSGSSSNSSARNASPARSAQHSRSPALSPSRSHSSAHEHSPSPGLPSGKRSASRIADAEKKRLKRAEMKKDPALYAEYLQKERERNARRRERLRAEKGDFVTSPNAYLAGIR
ncbi:hypothetical protein IWW38_006369 [Coemansia aciculifera]|uniref:Uncharacterized protein n=1 Tax=Coemansia aciculifera TaxID=417176 RepID=A0ACC1LSW7_9FUNG|nr:hypothetical protein IWW38_006369 [Coemansia aciculifera]